MNHGLHRGCENLIGCKRLTMMWTPLNFGYKIESTSSYAIYLDIFMFIYGMSAWMVLGLAVGTHYVTISLAVGPNCECFIGLH